MFTKAFLTATLERAVKTFAQSLAALLVADGTDIINTNWGDRLSVAAMTAVVSVLTSIGSGVKGDGPSLTNAETLTPKVAAEADADSPTGAVAGPAADIPEGDPVDVTPADTVQSLVTEALNQPLPGSDDDEPKPTGGYWGGV